jgi:hypothetical protein
MPNGAWRLVEHLTGVHTGRRRLSRDPGSPHLHRRHEPYHRRPGRDVANGQWQGWWRIGV